MDSKSHYSLFLQDWKIIPQDLLTFRTVLLQMEHNISMFSNLRGVMRWSLNLDLYTTMRVQINSNPKSFTSVTCKVVESNFKHLIGSNPTLEPIQVYPVHFRGDNNHDMIMIKGNKVVIG